MNETRMDEFRLQVAGGLRLGAVARMHGIRPELTLALIIIADLCRTTKVRALVTSLLDGKHMRNSLHYVGAAVDFTLDTVLDRMVWVHGLSERLGPNYDVIDGGNHVHVEYQPHVGAVT